MKVHHLSCGTMCPFGGSLVSGAGRVLESAELVCHCLLIESDDGLILVDAGFSKDDIESPKVRLGRVFMTVARPRFDVADTAAAQVVRLGFKVEDVRHVILTHADLDHAGGLSDFPHARVHLFELEHAALTAPQTVLERHRYRKAQFAHRPDFVVHPIDGESWRGFDALRVIEAAGPDLMMIPLPGHTRGHVGVAVREGDRWWLHAGDAYFHKNQMHDPPSIPAGLGSFQRLADANHAARVENQARLHALAIAKHEDLTIFCAHDPQELAACLRAAPHSASTSPT